jgi:hypothetical protein
MTGKIGFGEDTTDPVCSTLTSSANAFDKFKTLCDTARIMMTDWVRTTFADPKTQALLTIPTPGEHTRGPTFTSKQAKLIADALFYYNKNSTAITDGYTAQVRSQDPDLLERWGTMLERYFVGASARIPALLKNKVYTCSSLGGSRVISTDAEIEFVNTRGERETLSPGDPCRFGSEYPDRMFSDGRGVPNCGPSGIFCEMATSDCLRTCNCDAWPNPYIDLFDAHLHDNDITHGRFVRPGLGINGTTIQNGTDNPTLLASMNNPNDGSYKVCSAHDYNADGSPRDSFRSDCTGRCNCNYTCALAQAGARYASCFPDTYLPTPTPVDLPDYCTTDSHCDDGESCDLNTYSCVEPCERQLARSNCQTRYPRDIIQCLTCADPYDGVCDRDQIRSYCRGGH